MVDYALLKGNGMKNIIHFLESATKEASIALPVVLSREMLKKKKNYLVISEKVITFAPDDES